MWIALLLQPDWSSMEGRRDLTPVEVGECAALMSRWSDTLGAPELENLGARIKISTAEEWPVFAARVVTLVESRRVARQRRPYRGEELPPPSDETADPWKPPTPKILSYSDQFWRIPVKGSARLLRCPDCDGQTFRRCSDCMGEGYIPCRRCRASGRIECSWCHGRGHKSCTWCGGDGRRGFGRDRKRCTWCSGGRDDCSSCNGGQVECRDCDGSRRRPCHRCSQKGKVGCSECDRQGKVVDSDEIVIAVKAHTRLERFTRLEGYAWESQITLDGDWQSAHQSELDDACAKIPVVPLREFVAALAAAERRAAGPVRGQLVQLLRVPCRRLTYEFEGRTYEAVWAGDDRIMPDSPARPWARKQAEEAARLATLGRAAEAEALAAAALRADPECDAARGALDLVRSRTAPPPEPSRGVSLWIAIPLIVAAVVFSLLIRGLRRINH
jgi:hypothetical protein